MLPLVCSVIDHRGRQNKIKTLVTDSPAARVPLLCFYHILSSNVINKQGVQPSSPAPQYQIPWRLCVPFLVDINRTDVNSIDIDKLLPILVQACKLWKIGTNWHLPQDVKEVLISLIEIFRFENEDRSRNRPRRILRRKLKHWRRRRQRKRHF